MKSRRKNLGAIVSTGVCGALVFVGIVRLISYSRGATGDFIRSSALGVLGYNPYSFINVQFFKILATPSLVALIYFYFRLRNASMPSHLGAIRFDRIHRLDFKSAVLRGILTSVITVHWIGMEWWKFNVDGFYPYSDLEIRSLNFGVLLLSQALAFFGMKYLSFKPLLRDPPQSIE